LSSIWWKALIDTVSGVRTSTSALELTLPEAAEMKPFTAALFDTCEKSQIVSPFSLCEMDER
jgi:hypothetical protein